MYTVQYTNARKHYTKHDIYRTTWSNSAVHTCTKHYIYRTTWSNSSIYVHKHDIYRTTWSNSSTYVHKHDIYRTTWSNSSTYVHQTWYLQNNMIQLQYIRSPNMIFTEQHDPTPVHMYTKHDIYRTTWSNSSTYVHQTQRLVQT